MPQISIDIATAGQATRATDALCGVYDYTSRKLAGETRPQFAKRMVAEFVRNTVRSWAATQAAETARLAALATAETDAAGIS